MNAKVYTCFCTSVIHSGHLNIISEAAKLGSVVVGVLSDAAMIRYNRFPTLSLEERIAAVKSLEGVSQVVVQQDMFYNDIFSTLHPDIIVHGDNWADPSAPEYVIRQNVLDCIAKFGGKLVEFPYTFDPAVAKADAIENCRHTPLTNAA